MNDNDDFEQKSGAIFWLFISFTFFVYCSIGFILGYLLSNFIK